MQEKFQNDVQLREMASMLADYWLTKKDICKMFDLKNERCARAKVSEIAQELPVISSSHREGYKIATDKDDLDLLIRADNEIKSRIIELEKRRIPLQEAIQKRKVASQNKEK